MKKYIPAPPDNGLLQNSRTSSLMVVMWSYTTIAVNVNMTVHLLYPRSMIHSLMLTLR